MNFIQQIIVKALIGSFLNQKTLNKDLLHQLEVCNYLLDTLKDQDISQDEKSKLVAELIVDILVPGHKSLLEENTVAMEGTVALPTGSSNPLLHSQGNFVERLQKTAIQEFDDYIVAMDKVIMDPHIRNEYNKLLQNCLTIEDISPIVLENVKTALRPALQKALGQDRFSSRLVLEEILVNHTLDLL